MSPALVECIPNFSEGRDLEKVDQIVAAIKAVEGVVVLDQTSDSDHNRSVVTFVGSPSAVEEAAFEGIAKAAELIDLAQHRGEHPRLGATDVVPFVPISDVTMTDCIEIARRLGERVGRELNIPVYLYEKAATHPDRENLANLRKGEYEGLKAEIETNPERKPDFGPNALGGAGATVIGARSPLIAYNVYLDTDNVEIANKISRAVRHISGGFRYVKGLGLLVDGQAQISMNLTNYKRSPVYRVVEAIRREVQRYGVNVIRSELVGLIPQQALVDSAAWYLQLDDFDASQILENKIALTGDGKQDSSAEIDNQFLEDLASGAPTPGGGSAAAYSAAMAASLVAMVGRVTVNKKRYKDVEAEMWEIVKLADALREKLIECVDTDAAAFEAVMNAFRLPKNTEEEQMQRSEAIQLATLEAAESPLNVANLSVDVMKLAARVVGKGNLNAITDGATAASLSQAALDGARLNVLINLQSLDEKSVVQKMQAEIEALHSQAETLQNEIRAVLAERANL